MIECTLAKKDRTITFKIRRTGHLMLQMKDLERSKRFFTEVMKLPVIADNGKMLFFSTDVNENHHILTIQQGEPDAPTPTKNQLGITHVTYELGSFAELQEAYRNLKEHSVKIQHAVFHDITKNVYFYDPDSNVFELYYNMPPEEYRKSAASPYGGGREIEDELESKIPQRPGTVAP